MRVLFIYPNITSQEGISPALAYLSGYLRKKRHKTSLFDFTWNKNIDDCLKKIDRWKPDLIGFTSTAMDFEFAITVASRIKKNFSIPILFGGVQTTTAQEESISKDPVDMVCIGECEHALAEICDRMKSGKPLDDVRNLWLKRNGKIYKNPVRPLIQDLDSLPCDRSIYDFEKYLKARGNVIDIYAGRGCPYNCTYCINHVLQKMYKGEHYVRMRSVGNIINEIKELRKKYRIKAISFPDDTFTFNRQWVKEFCKRYQEIGLRFIINGRVENVDDEMAKWLSDAGCISILFGVESGSEILRKEVLNRHNTNKQIMDAFSACRKHGIKTFSFNMIGIPFETKKQIWETIKLNRKLKPDEVQATLFYPFPATDLFQVCENNGWIDKAHLDDYSAGSIMKYDHISSKELKHIRDMFAFHVFWPYDKTKAIRSLVIGKFYNIYLKLRGKTPAVVRQWAQRVANTFFFKSSH